MSSKKIPLCQKFKELRQAKNLSQRQLAEQMHVSQNYIYLVETGKMPSEMFIDLFLSKFSLDAEEFFQNVLLPDSLEQKSKKFFGPFVVAISLTAPANPLVAGALAAGIGITTVILRLCDAYGAKTEKDLIKKMNLGKNMVSTWKSKNNIPNKYIFKAAEETNRPIPWLLGRDDEDPALIATQAYSLMEEIIDTGDFQISTDKKSRIIGLIVREFMMTGEFDMERIKEVIELSAH